MDFGKILDQWDQKGGGQEHYSDKKDEALPQPQTLTRKQVVKMKPQDEIDLHGMTKQEAETVLDSFIQRSFSEGLRKVLIIHGKGNHSPKGPVLDSLVREYLEKSELCGEFGYAKGPYGGTGALWVLLRYRSR